MSPATPAGKLSARQWQVAELMLRGRSNKQIGLELGIAPSTVRQHAHMMYRQLGLNVPSSGQLVLRLQQLGALARPAAEPEPEGDLPPAWKAYLRAFDRLLRERSDVERRARELATMRDAATIDAGRESLVDAGRRETYNGRHRPGLSILLRNLPEYAPFAAG